MFIPFEQVRFEADDLADAYRKLRKSLPELTANSHMWLARWCLTHHQINFARQEIADALDMEPQRSDAKRMLERLNAAAKPKSQPTPPPKREDGFVTAPVESLAGLDRASAQEFVLKVQPILQNKCGNVRCHGSRAENDFKLLPSFGASSRIRAERNLANVLKYVDAGSPQKSTLLQYARNNHAPTRRAVFYGRAGETQLSRIENWLDGLADDARSISRNAIQQTSLAQATETSESEAATRKVIYRPPTAASDANELGRDAFDPAEFNRLPHTPTPYHPSAIRPNAHPPTAIPTPDGVSR